MDLLNRLKEGGVQWDELEAATPDEYWLHSRPIEGRNAIYRYDGALVFRVDYESENGPGWPASLG
jgi:hypothetical protein